MRGLHPSAMLPRFWGQPLGLIFRVQAVHGEFCPETSVNNHQHTLRNISEERRPQQHCSGNLKSHTFRGSFLCFLHAVYSAHLILALDYLKGVVSAKLRKHVLFELTPLCRGVPFLGASAIPPPQCFQTPSVSFHA
jgi:hypothetical protein